MDELHRAVRQATLNIVQAEGVRGLIGKGDGTVGYVDDAGTAHGDLCWARVGLQNPATEAVIRCVDVPQQYNLPVIIADRGGVLTAIRVDTLRAYSWSDGQFVNIMPHAWTHGRYGPDAVYIMGLQFLPFACHPAIPPDLTVVVEGGFYRYGGTFTAFETTTSDSLSAYVPASSSYSHFVLMCLDRSTNALAIVDGTDLSGNAKAVPTASEIEALTVPDAYWPLAAIRLYNGQTEILPRDICTDLRLWGGELTTPDGATGVGGPSGGSTDHAIARWDGTGGDLLQDSYPTIDDSGNVDLQGAELRDYRDQVIAANSGAAYEIDWSAAGVVELTLTDSPTLTFANLAAGRAITLILIQDGTGSRTVTWPASVDWPSTTAPTLSSGANDVDVITMIVRNDGTTVLGFEAGLDMG